MASARNPLQDLILTPQQQSLLFAALTANRPNNAAPNTAFHMPPLQYDGSPLEAGGSLSSFQNSPDLDYDYDFTGTDAGFDFPYDAANQPKMIGDLPGTNRPPKSDTTEPEVHEKRSHPDDGESPGAKRRESEEKVGKKPGRKPLTTEPTSVSSFLRASRDAAAMLDADKSDRRGRPRTGPRRGHSGSAKRNI